MVAKIVMQRVWLDNIDWDNDLLPTTQTSWKSFLENYSHVNFISLLRWVHYEPKSLVELHVFSDASERAFAGVVYIRIESPQRNVQVHLLTSKTRVAPLKLIYFPRLELRGAVLASELLKTILNELEIPIPQIYCCTDSTIVLAWLCQLPTTWTTFVQIGFVAFKKM